MVLFDMDYSGDFSFFHKQLEKHGITKEEFNIDNYVGLTFSELQGLVNMAIAKKEAKANARTIGK